MRGEYDLSLGGGDAVHVRGGSEEILPLSVDRIGLVDSNQTTFTRLELVVRVNALEWREIGATRVSLSGTSRGTV